MLSKETAYFNRQLAERKGFRVKSKLLFLEEEISYNNFKSLQLSECYGD